MRIERERYYTTKDKQAVNHALIHESDVNNLKLQAETFAHKLNALPIFIDNAKEFKLHGVKLLDKVDERIWSGADKYDCRVPRVDVTDTQCLRKLEVVMETWEKFPDSVIDRLTLWNVLRVDWLEIALKGWQMHIVGKHAKDKRLYVKTRAAMDKELFTEIKGEEYGRATSNV